jgi:cyclopropane-fatty-acyl-phospholipid synthase
MTVLLKLDQGVDDGPLRVSDLLSAVVDGPMPLRVRAFDGTETGDDGSGIVLDVRTPQGLQYVLTAPGDLGLARAYLTDNLRVDGVHPGDPYPLFRVLRQVRTHRPPPAEIARLARALTRTFGTGFLRPPPPPPQEAPARWRRTAQQLRARAGRAQRAGVAISHHYDVGNTFYEHVLGPSMTYTCAVYDTPDDTLEQAQARKYELVAAKLALQPGMRLLDVGCGWGGMVRHAAREHGVRALGVTLSAEQAAWAQAAIEREGLSHLAEVHHLDYRDAPAEEFDAVSSIGLTEHIGVRGYAGYFRFLHSRVRTGGRLLNHTITRPHGRIGARTEPFTDRYVFPDGELASPGRIVSGVHDAGFEVQHEENLRLHYAHTLAAWNRNLVEHWDACVAEVGEATAKVWGMYMAGSRLAFETNGLQLHQVLATKVGPGGASAYPLRPDWTP